MWTDARQATAWAFVWLLLVTAGFVLLRPRPGGQWPRWPLILLVAALVRLLPALWLPVGAGFDIDSYRLVTDALLSGQEVYGAVAGRHPYLPFQMYVMGAMAHVAATTGLPYVVAVKLPSILADVALTGLVYRAVADRRGAAGLGREWAAYLALLYALNPVSLLVSSYHGQFEAVTLLLLAGGWWLWERRRVTASAAILGLAILNKTWPVLFLPVVLIRLSSWRARLGYAALALGIPALAVVAYLLATDADPAPMLGRALTHRGNAGYWGPSAALFPAAGLWPGLQPLADALVALRNWLLAGAALLALWWTQRQSALDAFLTLMLAIMAVTVGFGIQWLVWLVPFALLAEQDRWARLYSLAAALMLAIHLYGLHMFPWLAEWLSPTAADWLIRLSALPAWGIVVAWLVVRLRAARAAGPATGQIGEVMVNR
jgi:hypothetical protein